MGEDELDPKVFKYAIDMAKLNANASMSGRRAGRTFTTTSNFKDFERWAMNEVILGRWEQFRTPPETVQSIFDKRIPKREKACATKLQTVALERIATALESR